jgi:hypothetical protein
VLQLWLVFKREFDGTKTDNWRGWQLRGSHVLRSNECLR